MALLLTYLLHANKNFEQTNDFQMCKFSIPWAILSEIFI